MTLLYPKPVDLTQPTSVAQHINRDVQQFNDCTHSIEALSSTGTTLTNKQFASYADALAISWTQEPYSKGAWSNVSNNNTPEELTVIEAYGEKVMSLFQPANQGTLFIAGEHSALIDKIGTLEAVVESGERTARMIQNQLKGALIFSIEQ